MNEYELSMMEQVYSRQAQPPTPYLRSQELLRMIDMLDTITQTYEISANGFKFSLRTITHQAMYAMDILSTEYRQHHHSLPELQVCKNAVCTFRESQHEGPCMRKPYEDMLSITDPHKVSSSELKLISGLLRLASTVNALAGQYCKRYELSQEKTIEFSSMIVHLIRLLQDHERIYKAIETKVTDKDRLAHLDVYAVAVDRSVKNLQKQVSDMMTRHGYKPHGSLIITPDLTYCQPMTLPHE